MNDNNRIINFTIVYHEAIGYTNVHRKGCGKRFFYCILQRYGAEESMDNILQTQDLCRFYETLPNWRIMDTIGLKPDAVPDVPLHINKENDEK